MNKRKCEHVWEQPHSLAAFFFIQLMIVFSFCKRLVEDISGRHVNYCFFNKLICSENWRSTVTELTDCLTFILRMMSRVNLFLDLTWLLVPNGLIYHHTRGLKDCIKLLEWLWETSLPPCCCTISNVYNQEAYAHNKSVNWVFTLLDYQN